jgi:hypothetical protein
MEDAQDQDSVVGLDIGNDVTAMEMGAEGWIELRSLPAIFG